MVNRYFKNNKLQVTNDIDALSVLEVEPSKDNEEDKDNKPTK